MALFKKTGFALSDNCFPKTLVEDMGLTDKISIKFRAIKIPKDVTIA